MRSQIVSRVSALLFAVLWFSGLPFTAVWGQTVFINEIHYDNTGTDAGEAIEIAGPAGMDLTGWSIVLYNGATGLTYDTDALSGTIPDLCNGFGVVVLTYPVNGIQNGSPDAIALVDASNTVIQFLSYEGTFTALNGPANGMTSVDIGVSEVGTEPLGQSLQLTGTGCSYGDFTWNSPAAASFGSCNSGQTFTTNITFSQASYQYNEDGAAVGAVVTVNRNGDLSGTASVDVQFTDGSATGGAALGPGVDYVSTTQTINFIANQASQTVTISINDDSDLEGDETFVATLTNVIGACIGANDMATITIFDNEAPPSVAFTQASYQYNEDGVAVGATVAVTRTGEVSGTSSIDVQFSDGTATGGAALGAGIDYINTTQTINFIANQTLAAVSISINDDADFEGNETFTVTLANPVSAVIGSPGTATVTILNNDEPPTPVVINELDSDTPGTDALEFVELYDGGAGNTPLDGLVLVFFNGSTDLSYAAFDLDGFSTDADGFFLIGNSGVTPTPSIIFGGNTLQNGEDAVALYLANASDFPTGTPVTTSLLVDAIVYDTNDPDDPGLLVLLNPGQPQVNENGGGDGPNHSNARVPDGGIRRNTDTYVQQAPTPGVSNVPPIVVAEIFEIQGAGLTSPLAGQTVTSNDNIVTAVGLDGFFMQTPDARADADANTSNGIFVFTNSAPTVAVGDNVSVTGLVQEFFNFTEFSSNPAVVVNSSGNPLPAAVQFDSSTPSPFQPQSAVELERFEGMLVEIASGLVSGPNQRFGTDPLAEVHIVAGHPRAFREPGIIFPGLPGLPVWDGNPEVFELDPDRLGLPNAAIPAGSTFQATGVLGFEFSGYELWPTQLTFDAATILHPVRAREDGEFMVATFNMERFFDDVDDPAIDDPVPTASEYAGILSKYSQYIREVLLAPDILAVQEVENLNALQDLAAQIQSDDASLVYSAFLEEGNDVGGIDVGFLVRNTVTVNSVTQLHKSEIFTFDNSLLHDRPPLLAEVEVPDGRVLTLMNLHQRSFSGIEGPDSTRIRLKRHTQAVSVSKMVDSLQTENPNINLIVLGDFNSFQFTDGYVHVLGQIMGTPASASEALIPGTDEVDSDLRNEVLELPTNERYSFVFGGSAQVLDHILTSEKIQGKVTGRQYARGNSDAPALFKTDYSTVLRASDHDAMVLYLDLTAPEIVVNAPVEIWPPNHIYHTFETTDFVQSVNDPDLSVADVFITSVTSDEAVNAPNSGNTANDIVIVDCQTVKLRAERVGDANGRVYTIYVAAVDANGNVGSAAFQVQTPIDQSGSPVIDDGPAYEVQSGCSAPNAPILAAKDSDAQLQESTFVPAAFALAQNYPNPFNPSTTIHFDVPQTGDVTLSIYNLRGQLVRTLVSGVVAAGRHQILWDGADERGVHVASGIYLYRLQADGFTAIRKLVLTK